MSAKITMEPNEIDNFRKFANVDWPEIEIKETLTAQFDDGDRKILFADIDGKYNGIARYSFLFKKALRIGKAIGKLFLEMHATTKWEQGFCTEIDFAVARDVE